jgi:hypothetical protein
MATATVSPQASHLFTAPAAEKYRGAVVEVLLKFLYL